MVRLIFTQRNYVPQKFVYEKILKNIKEKIFCKHLASRKKINNETIFQLILCRIYLKLF